jgi:hypothetical protein
MNRSIQLSLLSLVVVSVAFADGPPAADPLVYSGMLEEGGVGVTGPRDIKLNFWSDATLSAPANNKCQTTPAAKISVTSGRFSVPLDASCAAAVKANPDLWVEVIVENQSMGRTKLSAVPFAIEAARANDAAGALKARLDSLQLYTNATTGKRMSLNGSYCGQSLPVTGAVTSGSTTGFPATKAICEQVCGQVTAHMCSDDELTRYAMTGGTLPTPTANTTYAGWISGGNSSLSCLGYTNAAGSSGGLVWLWSNSTAAPNPAGYASSVTCTPTALNPILCCN